MLERHLALQNVRLLRQVDKVVRQDELHLFILDPGLLLFPAQAVVLFLALLPLDIELALLTVQIAACKHSGSWIDADGILQLKLVVCLDGLGQIAKG